MDDRNRASKTGVVFVEIFGWFAIAGVVIVLAMFAYIVVAKPETGHALPFAMLAAGFAAFTGVQIWQDGLVMFWTNHTANLTGTQVWWDLLISVSIALFLLAPRARKAGMNVPAWAILVALTASIGLLAMLARMFWLEHAAKAASGEAAEPKV